jgi:hypothetical protein
MAGGSTISKAKMLGTINLLIKELEINYSTNSTKCTFKFDCEPVGTFTDTRDDDDYL